MAVRQQMYCRVKHDADQYSIPNRPHNDLMTSLRELCRTEEHKKITAKLEECGIRTDGDLLLADDAALRTCDIPKFVLEKVDWF